MIHSSLRGNPLGTPVIGQLPPRSSSTVVAESASKVVEAFQPSWESDPETIWPLPGRGSAATSAKCAHLVGLTGNGILGTVFFTRTLVGTGRVIVAVPQGWKSGATILRAFLGRMLGILPVEWQAFTVIISHQSIMSTYWAQGLEDPNRF